jgi:putative cell wall-binding protein
MKSAQRHRGFVLSGLVIAALLVAPLQATAASAEDAPDTLEVMGEYNPADFVAEASELPVELVEAIDRDLGLTAETYLAESEAAVQASDVVDSLEDAGIPVLGSSIDGTDLTVYVETDAAATVVESVGATAEIGAPVVAEQPELPLSFAADIYDGQGYYWEKSTDNFGYQCSIGFNGYKVSDGAPQLATAGHCTGDMNDISGSVRALNFTAPGQPTNINQLGSNIGLPVAGTTRFGLGYDVGRIAVTGASVTPKAQVLTWGNGSGAPLASTPLSVTRTVDPTIGANLCRSGSRTGWRCGPITDIDTASIGDDATQVHSIIANVCVLPGDSGGAAMIGSAAVGITSWRAGDEGAGQATCATTPYSGFFPVQGSGETVTTAYGADWEVAVNVATPVPSFSGTGALNSTFSGTLANSSAANKVNVYIDGSSTPIVATVSGGSWSVPLSSVATGLHSYRLQAQYGTWSKSASATGWFTKGVTVDRIAGANRYATAAAVAAKFGSADVVYVAYGLNYPDALSAAPAAAFVDGPLLLTDGNSLPVETGNAIKALDPSKIIIVGGTAAISTTVFRQLQDLIDGVTVVRQAGPGRYETSRLITDSAFPAGGTSVAYIATGSNFPDALAATASAGKRSAPVILVDGSGTTIDQATKNLLADLGVTQVYIAGGPVVVSQKIEDALEALPGVSADRLAGADRFTTGVAINMNAFTVATDAYLAVGSGYADALAGAALAGATDSPLFVVPGHCVPPEVLQSLATLDVSKIHLLGGTAVLTAPVASLRQC